MSNQKIKVRFPPSPTGFLHIGSLRTALFNYLFAKNQNGEFLLRIEDTDRTRLVENAEEQIIDTLKIFDLAPDNLASYVRQSDRKEQGIYKKYADQLVAAKHAYECFCSLQRLEELRREQTALKKPPMYDRHCLKLSDEEKNKFREQGTRPVIRLKIPEGTTTVHDLIYGDITVENKVLDDQVLLKSDGFPTYHLANVVDDHDMAITHVIRGEEWIPSTPKHIILYQMFGWRLPAFAHLPLIVKPDHKKLSKRDRAADVSAYAEFYEKEAVINYIALLGWNPKTEQEIFSKEELIENFDLEKVNRANAIFDTQKLNWVNKQWVRKKGTRQSQFYKRLGEVTGDHELTEHIAEMILERVEDFWLIDDLVKNEFNFFFEEPQYEPELLTWKKMSPLEVKEALEFDLKILRSLTGQASKNEIETVFFSQIGEQPKGNYLWPLRVALTGLRASPGPFEIIAAFLQLPRGKEVLTKKIQTAIAKLTKI